MKSLHLAQSVPAALQIWNDADWELHAKDGIYAKGLTGPKLRAFFQKKLSENVQFLSFDSEPCPNFDPVNGCPGHAE